MGGEVRGTEAGGKGTVQLNGAARGWNITIWGNEQGGQGHRVGGTEAGGKGTVQLNGAARG